MQAQGNPEELRLNAKWCGEYGPVNTLRPFDYSWYNAMKIEYSDINNYECWRKLGRGKYSEVYLGYCKSNNQNCVIKVLKPVKSEKIYREIKILQILYGGPNIVLLTDLVKEPISRIPCFVYEWIPTQESKHLFTSLNDFECRLYTYKVLQACDFAHQHGIMHRDIKPLNIIVDH